MMEATDTAATDPSPVPTDVQPPTPSPSPVDEPVILFRNVCPTDVPAIAKLERASYPADEAASRSLLQYRQHHAASFFRCAVLLDDHFKGTSEVASSASASASAGSASSSSSSNDGSSSPTIITTSATDNRNSLNGIGKIIGYITATRCHEFTEASMKAHDPSGKLLAIHSVVVDAKYRKRGLGMQMMENYLVSLKKMENPINPKLALKYPIEKIVLITKMKNVGFYLRSGFGVLGKSSICHGKEDWYDCELMLGGGAGEKDGKGEKKYAYWVMDSFAVLPNNDTGTGTGMGGSIATSGKGTGNPAAVVMITDGVQQTSQNDDDGTPEEEFDPTFEENQEWMKTVAREFNLSETAFIWKKKAPTSSLSPALSSVGGGETNTNDYHIRYYTCNGTEVDLCGHATLAASSVVFQTLAAEGKRDLSVAFHAKNNVLTAKPLNPNAAGSANGSGATSSLRIVMKFPSKESIPLDKGSSEEAEALTMIKESLFADNYTDDDFKAAVRHVGLDEGGDDLLVEVTSDAFSAMPKDSGDINFTPMMNWEGYKRGIIVCCEVSEEMKEQDGEKADFYSRFFGPKVGIEEDPVTGSAHCVLGPYFGKKLQKEFVVGSQRSERGGIVECAMIEDGAVRIAGAVNKAMSGDLYL